MKAWEIREHNSGGISPGVVFAESRAKAMMLCVYSYCDAWNCDPKDAFNSIRLRRLPSYDHLAPHYGSRCLCRSYIDDTERALARGAP